MKTKTRIITPMTIDWLTTGPNPVRIVFAHGAGAPMDSVFMEQMSALLSERGMGVARFEFPYMQERRVNGKKRPPDRQPLLLDRWREAIQRQACNADPLVIMGKSMGGRMASLIADECGVAGLICLGYPFHPPGKPEKTRTEHLHSIRTPTLIIQGARDTLGNVQDVENYCLSSSIKLLWLDDGDHDLKPRVKSGFTHEQHLQAAADAIVEFIGRVGGSAG